MLFGRVFLQTKAHLRSPMKNYQVNEKDIVIIVQLFKLIGPWVLLVFASKR